MKKWNMIALVVAVGVIAIIAAVPVGLYFFTYESHFDFRLSIANKGPELNGLILIVPLPQASGLLKIINESQLGVSVSPSGPTTYGYSLESVNTSDGEIMMLRILADFPESSANLPPPSMVLATSFHVNHPINTDHPVGKEPLADPMTNVTSGSDIDQSGILLPYDIVYDSIYYTNFAGNISSGGISIELTWTGWNEWFTLGWQGSSFEERIRIGFTEPGNVVQVPPLNGWNAVRCGIWTGF